MRCYRFGFINWIESSLQLPDPPGAGETAPLFRLKNVETFILKRLVFFLRVPSGLRVPFDSSSEACVESTTAIGVVVRDEYGAVTVVVGSLDGRSTESWLTMLVPCVLGESGILPVVALVA